MRTASASSMPLFAICKLATPGKSLAMTEGGMPPLSPPSLGSCVRKAPLPSPVVVASSFCSFSMRFLVRFAMPASTLAKRITTLVLLSSVAFTFAMSDLFFFSTISSFLLTPANWFSMALAFFSLVFTLLYTFRSPPISSLGSEIHLTTVVSSTCSDFIMRLSSGPLPSLAKLRNSVRTRTVVALADDDDRFTTFFPLFPDTDKPRPVFRRFRVWVLDVTLRIVGFFLAEPNFDSAFLTMEGAVVSLRIFAIAVFSFNSAFSP
mmetsp:Transcript_18516/g.37412  ORF Transcript_18516/g.37412 Transcript_18516/m.37412 type:complete len:263 (+) Transcript_18516:1295-2083(+)